MIEQAVKDRIAASRIEALKRRAAKVEEENFLKDLRRLELDLAGIMERAEVESEAGEQDGADGVAEAPPPIVNSGAAMHPDAEPFYPQHGSNHPEAGEDQSQGEGI